MMYYNIVVFKAYKFRIKDKTSKKKLLAMSQSVNFVWNFCNESQKTAVSQHKRWLNKFDFQLLLKGAHEDVGLLASTLRQVAYTYEKSRCQRKKPWLRWRSSTGKRRSLGWIPFYGGISIDDGNVTYMGNTFRIWQSRTPVGKLKSGSFSEDAQGRWYVNLVYEQDPVVTCRRHEEVGIDLGLKDIVTTSNDEKHEAQRMFRKLEDKLGRAQRANKKRQVRKIHAKIRNVRKDFNHKLSTDLVSRHGFIVVGNISALVLPKRMKKSAYDASWSQLRSYLRYKALASGSEFVEVNEAYTTQDCSQCSARCGPKGLAGLAVRGWKCENCGTVHDRDVNAARNILRLGYQARKVITSHLTEALS